MKVCVFGAGAIGGVIAHGLAQVKEIELSLIARGAHLAAMQENGLTVIRDGKAHTVKVRAAADAQEFGPQDAIFSCVKSYEAWQFIDKIKPLLGEQTTVLTCQNGMPWWYFHGLDGPYRDHRIDAVDRDNRQWRTIGPERVIGTSIYPAVSMAGPGIINHTYSYRIDLGEPSGEKTQRVLKIADVLTAAGFEPNVIGDIRREIWVKLWGNMCSNPISALTRATLDVVIGDPSLRGICRAMMLEAQPIAEDLGIEFPMSVDQRIEFTKAAGAHRTSMLQDVDRGKPLEIDAILTSVQELGRLTGRATPTVDQILGLVQQMGRSLQLYPTYPEPALA